VISGHNNYHLWGPGDVGGEVLIAIVDDPTVFEEFYGRVERIADVDCRHCDALTDSWSVYVCRDPRVPFERVWARARRFI
jgi:hypothetical protein